ncbi:hypothetical protein D3C81_1732380 [compost metagenome]
MSGNTSVSAAELTDDVLEEMKDRGYLIGKNGVNRNVLAFQPPLVVTAENIDGMLKVLNDVLLLASHKLSAAVQAE